LSSTRTTAARAASASPSAAYGQPGPPARSAPGPDDGESASRATDATNPDRPSSRSRTPLRIPDRSMSSRATRTLSGRPRPRGAGPADGGRGVCVTPGSAAEAAVPEGEAERRREQPQCAGDPGHVLERGDAQHDGETAQHQADEADPPGHDASARGDVQTEAGETGQGPQPGDRADPVVVHRGA